MGYLLPSPLALPDLCSRWEWPPAVCGKHTNLDSLENSKRWCMTSYRIFDKLARIISAEEHGVRMRLSNFFFHKNLGEMPEQLQKMQEIESMLEVCCNSWSLSSRQSNYKLRFKDS